MRLRLPPLSAAFLALALFTLCCGLPKVFATSSLEEMINEDFAFAEAQYSGMLQTLKDQPRLPRSNDKGQLKLVKTEDWTSGFFPGALWLIYDHTRAPKWREAAAAQTAKLEGLRHFTRDHDIGFMLGCSFGQAYRLTGDPAYHQVLLDGAQALSTRFQPKAGILRSWDFGKWRCPVIIDNMMNLELLLWAAREGGGPRPREIAVSHANTTLANHFREDASSFHLVDYDPQTGSILKKQTVQGYADNSAWARGQAWGVYGYTMLYRETRDPRYLAHARRIAEFIRNHPNLPEDKIPYWDFNAPDIPTALRDSSAAAIMASALLELCDYVEPAAAKAYEELATRQLQSLSSPRYRAKLGENHGFLLLHGVGHIPEKHEIDTALIYGDYYFLEALLRLKARLGRDHFTLQEPDPVLSPHTGMTRRHWYQAAHYMLEGAFSYVHSLDDPLKFPKQPGKSYPRKDSEIPTEKLEGLCRTLFAAAPLLKANPALELNGIKIADYYRHQFGLLVDPTSPSFISPRPPQKGPSQNLVELGALSMAFFAAPEVLWDPLPKAQRDALASLMLSYGDGPTVPSNWKFFNIFVMSFLKSRGYAINEPLLVEYLEKALADYRGEGWYNDNPAYDYYSMWAYQLYGMLWAQWYGKEHHPALAARFVSNFWDMKDSYPRLFGRDGKMIMWGRSNAYRFASVSPLPLMGLEARAGVNYGWMRRISSGVLLQFLSHPRFMEQRVPSLGFYGPFEPAVQVYSCRGSVYWMGKIFLGLCLPADTPFWTAVENEGPWSTDYAPNTVVNTFQQGSGILITNYPNSGASEIRAWCHERASKDWQQFRSTENYNRLAYNSAFPWQADGPKGEVAMNFVVRNQKQQWEPLRLYTFHSFDQGSYLRSAVLETDPKVRFELADHPLPDGTLRIDHLTSDKPLELRFGHYALPQLQGPVKVTRRERDGQKAIIIDNGRHQLALVSLAGWDELEVVNATGLHPEAAESSVINASVQTKGEGSRLLATLLLWKNSGEPWSEDALFPVAKLTEENGSTQVTWRGGTQTRVGRVKPGA